MKQETAAHLRHSSLWVTGLERGALSEYCRNTLFRIPGASVQEMLPEGHILAWKIRASDSSSHFGCQLALWSWTNHFNRDTEGDLRLLHSAILHSSLARASVQQGFHENGKGMYQGLLILFLSSCLKTTQQAYSWAHFLLSLCFSLNLNAHPNVDILTQKSFPPRQWGLWKDTCPEWR